MNPFITRFTKVLSDTVRAWEEFRKLDIGYFDSDGNSERRLYIQKIAKSYSGLDSMLADLKNLRQMLEDTDRDQISYQTHRAAIKGLGVTVLPFVSPLTLHSQLPSLCIAFRD